MRTAKQAHVSTVSHPSPRHLLACVVMAVLATVALLVTWHPVVVHAQEAPKAAAPQAAGTVEQPAKVQPAKATAAKSVNAKDTLSTSHQVKAGETLWSIATRYYGDGHQWRAVARRNGIALSSDTALRVGTKLIIPSRRSAASVAMATASLPAVKDTATPKVATTPAAPALPARPTSGPVVTDRPGGALAAQTADKANASAAAAKRSATSDRASKPTAVAVRRDSAAARDTASMTPRTVLMPQAKSEKMLTNLPARIGLVDAADLRAARPRGESPTVFELRVPDASVAAASARAVALHAEAAPRHGEYAAAPFAIAEKGWAQAGHVVRRLDDAGAKGTESTRMQLADEVEITAPLGAKLTVGDRLVAVKHGGLVSTGLVAGIPTGILQVTRVDAGGAVHAYVRSETGVVEQGDALFAVDGVAGIAGQRFETVSGADVQTTVTWVDSHELLPTLQSYVMLAAGQPQGVKPGEQFALVRRSAKGGEERIAVVRIVRVSANGSSAIVIGQSLPEIASGVTARRITRLP